MDTRCYWLAIVLLVSPGLLCGQNEQAAQTPPKKQEDPNEVIARMTEQLQRNPRDARAYLRRGLTYHSINKMDLAFNDVEAAFKLGGLSPAIVEATAHHLRALLHRRKKQYWSALADYQKVAMILPASSKSFPNLHADLGYVQYQLGNFKEAIAECETDIRMNPESALPYDALALVLATCPEPLYRDGAKAIDYATKACERTKWTDPQYLLTLAAAHAESGNFPKAVETTQNVLQSKHPDASVFAVPAKHMLALFQDGKPMRRQPENVESKEKE